MSAAVDDLDILWDSYSHREIVELVNTGPGASLTAVMEQHLKQVAGVLNDLSDQVSGVIQRTGEDWQGGAADVATNAMWVLRSIDDGMYFTSNLAGIRAFGQSDSAGWVRANMPPVVEVHPPEPTGRLIDIFNATVDYQKQQAAAKQAEQRAREIMQQYTEASRERAAAMTPLTPVPQVVVDISDGEPPSPPPRVESPPEPRDPGAGPRESGPVAGPGGGAGPVQPGPTEPNPTSPPVTPGSTQPAVAPGQGSAPIAPGSPNGPVPAPGGSGATAPPPAGGFVNERSGGRSGLRPLSEGPGRGGAPVGGRVPADVSRVGAAPAGRGAAGARGTAAGAASPFGVGPGARREEDREHQVRYGLPSAEHFEPDDPVRDPHREGWCVAPEVIGDLDEEGDHQ